MKHNWLFWLGIGIGLVSVINIPSATDAVLFGYYGTAMIGAIMLISFTYLNRPEPKKE